MTTRTFSARLLGVALAGALLGTPAVAATVSLDRDAFIAAQTVPLVFETFDENRARANTLRFDSGITSTVSSPGVPPTLHEVNRGNFLGFVARLDFRNILWEFDLPVFGFGADFGSAGTAFNSLKVTGFFADGGSTETFSISEALGRAPGFFGLSSDIALASLLFTTDTGLLLPGSTVPLGGQTFSVDNVVLAPIPVPPGIALMLGALGIGTLIGRRRKQPA